MQQHQELAVREFEEYCKSDELSIATLREKTRRIPPFALSESDAFIFACENGRVTRAVVEHFLRVYPDLVGQRRCVETGRVVANISSGPGEDTPFPLQALVTISTARATGQSRVSSRRILMLLVV